MGLKATPGSVTRVIEELKTPSKDKNTGMEAERVPTKRDWRTAD